MSEQSDIELPTSAKLIDDLLKILDRRKQAISETLKDANNAVDIALRLMAVPCWAAGEATQFEMVQEMQRAAQKMAVLALRIEDRAIAAKQLLSSDTPPTTD